MHLSMAAYPPCALIDDGTDINAKDNDGGAALMGAAGFGHADTARLLIDAKATGA